MIGLAPGNLNTDKWSRFLPWTIALGVLIVYVSVPTKNYYWDGVLFAWKIEAAPAADSSLFHSNHLLYNHVGYVAYHFMRGLGLNLRAIEAMQVANSLFGAASVVVLFRILLASLGTVYISACLALLFGFSATWWRFATDANAYIPSVLCLLVSFYFVLPTRRSRPVLVALFHSAAMLLHQLAVFMYPILAIGILRQASSLPRKRKIWLILQYTITATLLTLGTYYYCFYLKHGTFDLRAFAEWVTSTDPSQPTGFGLWRILTDTLQAHVRLVFGGRLALALRSAELFTIVVVCLLAVLLVAFAVVQLRNYKDLKSLFRTRTNEKEFASLTLLTALWAGIYVVFHAIWLRPFNTFHRLFYVPALILLVGILLARNETAVKPKRKYRLAIFVVAVMLSNFTFSVLPNSRVESNPVLAFALEMNDLLKPGDVVYYSRFSVDDWTIRYFNPGTTWRELKRTELKPKSLAKLESEIEGVYDEGHTVWIDTTAIDLISGTPAGQRWLAEHTDGGSTQELTESGFRVRFFRVRPHPASAPDSRGT